jgi:adenylate cyclase
MSSGDTSIPQSSCVIRPQRGIIAPGMPDDEAGRLAALRKLNLLDTSPEERFDRVVKLTMRLFSVPVAYVALIDGDRQWFKSEVGMEQEETPRNTSFCGHAILQDTPLVITDARRDMRFAGNPMVIGPPFLRFYAGRPLRAPGGFKVGTLCAADTKARQFGAEDLALLHMLAGLLEREFELADAIAIQRLAQQAKEALVESERRLSTALAQVKVEKSRAESLIANILPATTAEELQKNGCVVPMRYEEVAVMFADFSGFTKVAAKLSPEEVVDELNDCFCHFDWVVGKYGCEKLKTIGDGYLAVCGLPEQRPDAALQLLKAAIDIRDEMEKHYEERVAAGHESWHVRIGLHIGPLVAGVVGVRRIAYDIWGDTVNTASRIESNGEPGRINVSRAFYDKVADQVVAVPRGEIECKNKGPLEMFFIDGLREEVTA